MENACDHPLSTTVHGRLLLTMMDISCCVENVRLSVKRRTTSIRPVRTPAKLPHLLRRGLFRWNRRPTSTATVPPFAIPEKLNKATQRCTSYPVRIAAATTAPAADFTVVCLSRRNPSDLGWSYGIRGGHGAVSNASVAWHTWILVDAYAAERAACSIASSVGAEECVLLHTKLFDDVLNQTRKTRRIRAAAFY